MTDQLLAQLAMLTEHIRQIAREEEHANLSKYDCPSGQLRFAIEDAVDALSASPAIVEKWLEERDAKVRRETLESVGLCSPPPAGAWCWDVKHKELEAAAFARGVEACIAKVEAAKETRSGWVVDVAKVKPVVDALRALLPVLPEKKEPGR